MVRVLSPRPDHFRGTTQVLFLRPDRPRAIDRMIRYFGDAPTPALVTVRSLGTRRSRKR
jgi:hypothetical protein